VGITQRIVDQVVVEEGLKGIGWAVLLGPVYVLACGCGLGAGEVEIGDFQAAAVPLGCYVVVGDVEG